MTISTLSITQVGNFFSHFVFTSNFVCIFSYMQNVFNVVTFIHLFFYGFWVWDHTQKGLNIRLQVIPFPSDHVPNCWLLAHFKRNPKTFNKVVQRTVNAISLRSVLSSLILNRGFILLPCIFVAGNGELAQSHQAQITSSSLQLTSCYHTPSS